MTTLTLDQLKLILCEQNDVNSAAQLMRDMGFDVTECTVGFPTYHFDFKPYTVIFRDDKREGGFSFTILERFDLKERKAFLESQQQPTDTVPAVSTAGEARPYSEPPTHDAYGAMFEAITCINCDRWAFEPLLSENGIHLICLHCHHQEWLGFGRELSTESVDKAGE